VRAVQNYKQINEMVYRYLMDDDDDDDDDDI